MAVIKSEFFLALNQVASERGISPEDVLESIKAAVLAAYKKDYAPESVLESQDNQEEDQEEDDGLEVKINQESGEMHILQEGKDITPPGFGRIAAQTARQVILQQIREAEKRTIVQHYTGQVGTIVKGRVIRFDGRNVLLDIGKAEGHLPQEEQIRSERYRLNDTVTVYIKEIKEDDYGNSKIILSRSHPDLVKELFVKEVPEIESGTVEIKGVVREPGERTKISVHSDQSGVDPVGACVGQKGIRVKSVTEALGGAEKIDIIQYNEDDEMYIREALSPAEVKAIRLNNDDKRAEITVEEAQAPLAIGKNGVNVNLASRLTGYEIDIVQIDDEGEKVTPDTPVEEPSKKAAEEMDASSDEEEVNDSKEAAESSESEDDQEASDADSSSKEAEDTPESEENEDTSDSEEESNDTSSDDDDAESAKDAS